MYPSVNPSSPKRERSAASQLQAWVNLQEMIARGVTRGLAATQSRLRLLLSELSKNQRGA